jgi:hypothetical protein
VTYTAQNLAFVSVGCVFDFTILQHSQDALFRFSMPFYLIPRISPWNRPQIIVYRVINISGEVSYTKSWLKIASGEKTRTVVLAESNCERGFCGSSLWEWVCDCRFWEGFCGTRLWELILWQRLVRMDFVQFGASGLATLIFKIILPQVQKFKKYVLQQYIC